MPFSMTCEHCRKRFHLPDEIAGKHFKCSSCSQIILAPEATSALPPTATAPNAGNTRHANADSPVKDLASVDNAAQPIRDAKVPSTKRHSSTQQANSHQRPRRQKHREKPRRRKRRRKAESDFDHLLTPAVGSYGASVGIPRALEREIESEVSREMNPQLFEEFDAVIKELAVFFIGFGIIVAILGCVAQSVTADVAIDWDRGLEGIPMGLKVFMTFAAAFGLMGLLTLTRVIFILNMLTGLCALLCVASGLFVVGNLAGLFIPIPISFFVASQRLLLACRLHP